MTTRQKWLIAYYFLFAGFVVTAALGILHVHAGLLSDYGADLMVPAWLYVVARGLHEDQPRRWLHRLVGRSPEIAALAFFSASALTEISQYYWPHGPFAGQFDPLDIVAYGAGIAACYIADRRSRLTNDEAPSPGAAAWRPVVSYESDPSNSGLEKPPES